MSAQRNASLASAAANAASGNYVQAAANFVSALFSGSGKTPSVLQGFDVQGTFGSDGFQGSVTAFDQKGNRWDQPLEAQWLNSLGLGLLTDPKYGVSVDGQRLRGVLSGGAVPVAAIVPGDSTYPTFLASAVAESVGKTAAMNAPKIDSEKSTAQPAAPASSLDPVASAFAGMDQVLTLVAVVGLILYAMKES